MSFNRYLRNVCTKLSSLSSVCMFDHHILIAQTMFTAHYIILSPSLSFSGPDISVSSKHFLSAVFSYFNEGQTKNRLFTALPESSVCYNTFVPAVNEL